MDYYKKIYSDKVLPKKAKFDNSKSSYISDVQIYNDFSDLRARANNAVLGGDKIGEK